jgi:hypothetical protein
MIDPAHKWGPEPIVEFSFPTDPACDRVTDYFSERLKETISPLDALYFGWLFNDFVTWDATEAHRNPPNEYRIAASKLAKILAAIDDIMTHSSEPLRDWQQISLALCLPSSHEGKLTEEKIGEKFGVCKMAVSKSIKKLLRLAELPARGHGYNGRQF